MSPKEREVWITTLNYGPAREDAAKAILDRVESLEVEVRSWRDAYHTEQIATDKLAAELRRAKAEPRHCGKVIAQNNRKRCLSCGDVWSVEAPGIVREEAKTDG